MFNSIKMSHKHQKFTVTAIVALFYSLFCFVRFVDVLMCHASCRFTEEKSDKRG